MIAMVGTLTVPIVKSKEREEEAVRVAISKKDIMVVAIEAGIRVLGNTRAMSREIKGTNGAEEIIVINALKTLVTQTKRADHISPNHAITSTSKNIPISNPPRASINRLHGASLRSTHISIRKDVLCPITVSRLRSLALFKKSLASLRSSLIDFSS